MSEKEAIALLKEKCTNGNFDVESKKARGYDVVHSKQFYCRRIDTKEDINLIVHDKVDVIISERNIDYPDNLPDTDKKTFLENIYAKLLEKYGTPTHEAPKGKDSKIDYINGDFDIAACWGDCSLEKGYSYTLHAGKDLFAAGGVDNAGPWARIHRVLADPKAVKAADEAFEKAIEAAKNQEAEAAKQQAQQATENIKF